MALEAAAFDREVDIPVYDTHILSLDSSILHTINAECGTDIDF